MKTTLGVIGAILMGVGILGMFGFHLYTAWLANKEFGAFWGFIVFSSPPFADLYWIGHMIMRDGLISFYTECLAGIVGALSLGQYLCGEEA